MIEAVTDYTSLKNQLSHGNLVSVLADYSKKYVAFLIRYIYICYRSSRPEVFLVKGVLKMCSKFTGEHPCGSVISIKLQSNFIEITFQLGCSPVNLLHIFRTPLSKNTSRSLLLRLHCFGASW